MLLDVFQLLNIERFQSYKAEPYTGEREEWPEPGNKERH